MAKIESFFDHLDAYAQGRKGILLSRMLVRFTFLTSLLNVILSLVQKDDLEVPKSIVTFYSAKAFFIVLATIVNWVRYSPKFYIPLLRELSEATFWNYILAILFLLRVPFAREFFGQSNTIFALLHVGISVVILGVLLMGFQSRNWTYDEQKKKIKRIRQLRRKARLSPSEYEQIKPLLLESAKKKESRLTSWKILSIILSLIFAATINDAASELVDLMATRFDIFKNLLPPY